jgi:hypothetical protein
LALVSVLAGGDYLLWNWSLQSNHDVLALVAGLTLPPLAIALIWLLALNTARLLARAARVSQQRQSQQPQPSQQQRPQRWWRQPQGAIPLPEPLTQHEQHPGGEQVSSSSKLAA